MARAKDDGKGRLGGRAKGTPNKATATLREWVGNLIDKNRRQVERDLKALEPKDRLAMIEKLLQYVMPKQQAVKAEVDLNNLSDAQLDLLVDELWERSQAEGDGDADSE
ncbi:MAG: hypothetical protein LIP09_07370 [Bacteroidales bacterium]|nr:hypothetical protein [Bacteroidales bacterium]